MRRIGLALVVALLLLPAPAPAQVRVQAYDLPPGGGRPHDVAVGADGIVWYTAQRDGKLGRLDPATGKVELVPLGRGASPHGVIIGPDGAPWVTEGGTNAIARVDPQSREVKSWFLPEGRGYVNLNTLTFDKRGRVWFTGQNGIYGRLDPATGDMKVWDAPRGRCPASASPPRWSRPAPAAWCGRTTRSTPTWPTRRPGCPGPRWPCRR
jgi:virginiamycin B lyase